MKKNKVDEFIKKVDRPWGMSKEELVKFQYEVIGLKTKLAEYENTGLEPSEVEELKKLYNIQNEREFYKKYIKEKRQKQPNLLIPDFDEVYKELAVYKKALEIASESSLAPFCNSYDEIEKEKPNDIQYYLNQARTEIENEKNSNN